MTDFWQRCIENDVIVMPFKLYSQWNEEGNISEENLIGVRFVCLPAGDYLHVVEAEPYLAIDAGTSDLSLMSDTPEGALENWCRAALENRLIGRL